MKQAHRFRINSLDFPNAKLSFRRVTWIVFCIGILFFFIDLSTTLAQADGVTPRLVKDIHTGTQGASFSKFIEIEGEHYVVTDPARLWRLDEESEELTLITDSFCPEGSDSTVVYPSTATFLYYSSVATWQGHLYYFCGTSLWRSDGTADGTTLFHEFPEMELVARAQMATTANALFITFPQQTELALWVSDGTTEGTTLVRSITGSIEELLRDYEESGVINGDAITYLSNLVTLDDLAYFTAIDSTYGLELWKSDGTAAGTEMVKDINPDVANSLIHNIVVVNDTLYFGAADGEHGFELWKSDGTTAGTEMVKDIRAGESSSYHAPALTWGFNISFFRPLQLTAVGDKLFFTASDGIDGYQLWQSDGTTAGTTRITDLPNEDSPRGDPYRLLTSHSNQIIFRHYGSLWRSDGTSDGTTMLSFEGEAYEYGFAELISVGERLFFSAGDSEHGQELWVVDSIAATVKRVLDIYPGPAGSDPKPIGVLNDILYFSAEDQGRGRELWRTDGTAEGTMLVRDTYLASQGSNPSSVVTVGDTIFFVAEDPSHGRELWKSDGTAEGTELVADLSPGADGSDPYSLTPVHDTLFFIADVPQYGLELWKSDGTVAGTVLVKDIHTAEYSTVAPRGLVQSGDQLFFTALDDAKTRRLWRSDGTEEGTYIIENINASRASIFAWREHVLVTESEEGSPRQLWISDGTEEGTQILKEMRAAGIYSVEPVGDQLYMLFWINDGVQIWRTDGTPEGTTLFAAINNTRPCEEPLTYANGYLYFAIELNRNIYRPESADNNTWCRLWRSGVTSGGTSQVRMPTAESANSASVTHQLYIEPENFAQVDGLLYFTAFIVEEGQYPIEDYTRQLWQTDGTIDGTRQITAIESEFGRDVEIWAPMGQHIYFKNDRKQLFAYNRFTGEQTLLDNFETSWGWAKNDALYMSGTRDEDENELWVIDLLPVKKSYLPLISKSQ